MVARAIALLALAAALAGCGERSEPLAGDVSPYPVTVRGAAGEPTRLGAAPERIVALTPGAAELLDALGARRRVVGVPAGVGVGGAARVVRPSGVVDVAAVERLAPDLVVASTETDEADLATVAERTGAAVYAQPGSSIRDVERATLELGFLVGEPVAARRLVASIRREVGRVQETVLELPRVRVFVDTGFFVTVPTDSLVADLVRRAGGTLVGDEPASPVTPCGVVALEPEVILRVVEGGPLEPPPPRFRACPSRRPPRVEEVPAALVSRGGPRVAGGFAAVARALHPGADL